MPDSARWARINELFHTAVATPAAERAAFLSAECGSDAALRVEVESLLAAHRDGETGVRTGAVAVGSRLGDYEVTGFIAAGGMGDVYRARDRKLGRDVAIKILPHLFTSDPERLARFVREARMLAALNHPNIGSIYGFEEADGVHALALELVEGDTLADRIARGKLPLDESLRIAKQIAEALGAAHEQGIVHRDLKPANIKVTRDGLVKVLDFGLAKLTEQGAGGRGQGDAPARTMSPTITSPAMVTGEGVLLGTAAYMSPEQAAGKSADKRSDLWAFGVVLFEMLTARPVFAGETISHVVAAVLTTEPDWTTLPAETPTPIRTLLRRCLEKDRKRRLESAADARLEIDDALAAPPAEGRVLTRGRPTWQQWSIAATVSLVAVVAGASVWVATRQAEPVPLRVSRLPLALSGAAALTFNGYDLAITPDGSRVIYVGNRGTQLFVRALDALEPVAVFTGTPLGPFVSPDGQWIGFVDDYRVLKRLAVTGGPPVTLATLDSFPSGATWGPEDAIIVATANNTIGLQRVAVGGTTTVLTRPDRAQGEVDHLWPEMLPGGRAVLFTITAVTGALDAAQVAVLDLQTGTRKILVRGGSNAHYVPSGHLVYAAAGTLRAVPFDLATLETRGTAVAVVPDVAGAADAVVAGNGTLAYVLGDAGFIAAGARRTLVWVDRQGRETAIPAPPRAYSYPRLSPDGTRIAVSAVDQENDLWLWDLARATLTRLTFEPGTDRIPVWTPDGRRLLFSSDRAGAENLYVQAADGTGSATRVIESANQRNPTAITADGTRVLFNELTPSRRRDLRLLTLTPTPRVEPLLETPFEERGGIVSPDGHWLAYESNNAGRFEIYVRPFPNVGAGQWQVSNAGGVQPLWSRSGQELFYLAPDGALMAVSVEPHGGTWAAGTATKFVEGRYFIGAPANTIRQYDVSPDGQRFLMIKEGGATDQTAAAPQLIIVQHWTEELKRLVPLK